METPALRDDLNQSYDFNLPEVVNINDLETILAEKINRMITTDFNGLIQLLYRIDVSEPALRQLLEQNPTAESGRLIAQLILERSWAKILTRKMYSSNQEDITYTDEEEKW